jgi:hypothetical protein
MGSSGFSRIKAQIKRPADFHRLKRQDEVKGPFEDFLQFGLLNTGCAGAVEDHLDLFGVNAKPVVDLQALAAARGNLGARISRSTAIQNLIVMSERS